MLKDLQKKDFKIPDKFAKLLSKEVPIINFSGQTCTINLKFEKVFLQGYENGTHNISTAEVYNITHQRVGRFSM